MASQWRTMGSYTQSLPTALHPAKHFPHQSDQTCSGKREAITNSKAQSVVGMEGRRRLYTQWPEGVVLDGVFASTQIFPPDHRHPHGYREKNCFMELHTPARHCQWQGPAMHTVAVVVKTAVHRINYCRTKPPGDLNGHEATHHTVSVVLTYTWDIRMRLGNQLGTLYQLQTDTMAMREGREPAWHVVSAANRYNGHAGRSGTSLARCISCKQI